MDTKTAADDLKTCEFVSFCMEMYAQDMNMRGAEVARHFEQYGVLDYLFANHEALHTQGWHYIFSLIEEYITGQEAG